MATPKKIMLNIIEENKKLKEELRMKKSLRENDAKVDIQVNPAQPVSISDGTSIIAPASADDMGKKYAENEVKADTQVNPSQPASKGDGSALVAVAASQDDLSQKDKTPVMEAVEEDEEDGNEKFKEFEGDMSKVTEILEALKARIEALEAAVNGKNAVQPAEQPAQQPAAEEQPMPPMTESALLGKAFAESIKPASSKEFDKVVQKVIFN